MSKLVTALFVAFGVACFIGGVCSIIYGITHPLSTIVTGLGPFDGIHPAENYYFFGSVLAAVGGGLTTFGLFMREQ